MPPSDARHVWWQEATLAVVYCYLLVICWHFTVICYYSCFFWRDHDLTIWFVRISKIWLDMIWDVNFWGIPHWPHFINEACGSRPSWPFCSRDGSRWMGSTRAMPNISSVWWWRRGDISPWMGFVGKIFTGIYIHVFTMKIMVVSCKFSLKLQWIKRCWACETTWMEYSCDWMFSSFWRLFFFFT